ncbi:hypothetical protein JI739_03300 [Ramlibacter sp. AW1]|uniref:Penicillin-binding protein transpeptidase domain-containing protein n=1 Tax=Ramlibacter aurantiacus TaxID=2801330 RepID=A0A936ZEB3_9BURK|nr:hypothetical protein [Ramlibacter aurantiacus]MBL0419367.1 hypothetical protein [Ramlibacter aurantiacus]
MPAATPPVIRQVTLVMLALCLLAPLALVLWAPRDTAARYEPQRTRAAAEAVLAAIDSQAAAPPDAARLATLLPHCTGEPPYQGLPFFEDLAEQWHALDRHLATLTGAPGQRNAPLRSRYHLQPAAWAEALRQRQLGCDEAAAGLRLLASDRGGRLLAQAQWRETRSRSAAGTPVVQLAATSLAQVDPWRGWPGCVWLGGIGKGSRALHVPDGGSWQRELCATEDLRPPEAGEVVTASPGEPSVPPDLPLLIAGLDPLRRPEGRLYQDYVQALPGQANRSRVGRGEIDLGFNVQLTIDPRTQAIAQRVLACYAGRPEACEEAGIARAQVGAAQGPGATAMWEGAAVRMGAVAVLDVASGRIEALASAHTPCWAQENDGPFRDAGCAPLWTEPRRRPDALLNHAVFTDVLPGSTIKPLLASVFLEDPAADAERLTQWLAASDTQRFNDALFCLAMSKAPTCDRPARVQQRAADLGWNLDCSARPDPRCGRTDLLFGRRLGSALDAAQELPGATPLQAPVLSGRLFVEPTPAGARLMPLPEIRRDEAARCRDSAGPSTELGTGRWHAANCSSPALKPLVNEAAGQGQARTTALGLAAPLARLAAAANGERAVRRPYLVERLSDARGETVATAATRTEDGAAPLAAAEPLAVAPAVARTVLRGLERANAPGGTAHLVCRHVFGGRCAEAGARIAGKTGTPSFSFDRLTLAQARQRCRTRPGQEDCLERPIKLYVAAVDPDPQGGGRYTKVVAVIVERNWMLPSPSVPAAQRDRVHGATNDANNVAAEIGMRVAQQAWMAR